MGNFDANPWRDWSTARYLPEQALMFLVGHEIAHISRGHVDFWNAVTGNAFIAELGWSGSRSMGLKRQALEVDADQRSSYARCYSMFGTAESNAEVTPRWADEPQSIEAYQYDWTFAVNSLFRLFGDEAFSGVDLKSSGYPPLTLRRRIALQVGQDLLLKNWGLEHSEKISEALFGSVAAVEFSFKALGADPPQGGFSDAFSNEADQQIDKISNAWVSIEQQLKTHAFEEL